jgi:hypothetical protein
MRNEGGAKVTERGAGDRRAAGEREGARWPSSRGRFHGAGCGGEGAAMQPEGGRSCGSHLVVRVTMTRKDRGRVIYVHVRKLLRTCIHEKVPSTCMPL